MRFGARLALAWALGVASAATAQAQGLGSYREYAYVSLAGGPTSLDTGCIDNDLRRCSGGSGGGRVALGLFVQPGLAGEIVLADYGRSSQQLGNQSLRTTLKMAGVGTALQLELGGGLAAVVRGGLAGTRTVSTRSAGTAAVATAEGNNLDLYAGMSVMWRVTRGLALEAGVDLVGLGDNNSRRDSGLMGSIGLSLRY